MIGGTKANHKPISELTRAAVLTKMFTYFKNAIHNSKPAQEYLQSRCLDFTNIYSYYDQKLEKCTDNSCFMINVNNRMDITLKIDKISIQLQDEISNHYQYLIVEKRGKRGIKLKYTNQL